MRSRWRAGVLAAAGAAMLLAGCGIRVSVEPSPSARPGTAAVGVSSFRRHRRRRSRRRPCRPARLRPRRPSVRRSAGAAVRGTGGGARGRRAPRGGRGARVNEALPAFDQLTAGMVARSGVPGAAVAVVAGDTAVYARCFGLRQVGSPDKVTEATLLPAGGGLAELHDHDARRARRRGRAALGPAGAPRVARLPAARSLGDARGDLPRSHGAAQRPAGLRRRGAAALRVRARRGPAPAAVSPAGRRIPRRLGAAGRGLHGGRRRRGAGHRRLVGESSCARACSSRSATSRRYSAIAPTRPHRTGPRRTGSSRVDGAPGPVERDGVRAVARRRLQPQRARVVRAAAAERRRARRRARGARRSARADARADDGRRRRAFRPGGRRPRLDGLELRRPAASRAPKAASRAAAAPSSAWCPTTASP